jgi:hypothetical protein
MEQEPKSSEWREKMVRWIRTGIHPDTPIDPIKEYETRKQKLRFQIRQSIPDYGIYHPIIQDKDEIGENKSSEPGFNVKIVFHDPFLYGSMIEQLEADEIEILFVSEEKIKSGYPNRFVFADQKNCKWDYEVKAIMFVKEWE